MHPGFIGWWREHSRAGTSHGGCGPAQCGVEAGRGPWQHGHGGHGRGGSDHAGWQAHGHDDGPSFGVRRPLRFMAHKLELSNEQVTALAMVLNDLKTERAQAAVDDRRRLNAISEAVEGESLDAAKLAAAATIDAESSEKVRRAVAQALERTHALLTPEQRKKLAYLLRTGVLTI